MYVACCCYAAAADDLSSRAYPLAVLLILPLSFFYSIVSNSIAQCRNTRSSGGHQPTAAKPPCTSYDVSIPGTRLQRLPQIRQTYRFHFASRYAFRFLGCRDLTFSTAGVPFVFFNRTIRHRIYLGSPHVQMPPIANLVQNT